MSQLPLSSPVRLLPASWPHTPTAARRLAIVAASALMALCAHVALPHVITPVPSTMQTFGVLLLGMTLGPLAGAAAMVLYLLEGAAGLPVFAPGGLPGLAHLAGPTAGFLFAYPVAAAAAGLTLQTLRPRLGTFLAAVTASLVGLVPIFTIGTLWLATALSLSAHHAIELAFLPFLPGEAVKLLLAAAVVTALHRMRPTTR